jgi:Cu2+-exporting ATPase
MTTSNMTPTSSTSLALPEACFHCGLPLAEHRYPVEIDGVARDTCCRGCQAVAQTIALNGLSAYYRYRERPAERRDAVGGGESRYELYDLPEVQKSFVRDGAPNEKVGALMLEGITCAACLWLIERRLAALEGVGAVQVNYATRRAHVRWDARRVRLSAILDAVAALGYEARPYDGRRSYESQRRERTRMLWRLFVAGFGMMQVMMYVVPGYVANGEISADAEGLMRWASLVLTVPVVAWSAQPFYAGAWREIRGRRLGMDVPVSLGLLAAFAASVHAVMAGGVVYFDSVSMFVFLLLAARFFEMNARMTATQSQERLAQVAPAVAERLASYPGAALAVEVPVATLKPGDVVRVRPGATVPADAVVIDGESDVDESLVTGEARPVSKRAGQPLIGGTLNVTSVLVARVSRVGEETVLAGILRLMDRAQSERPRIAQLADRVAHWFVAAQLAIALAAAVIWYVLDPTQALPIAVAVLVVTCPCALSIATPTALAAATARLHQSGLLVTRGHALEALAAARRFVFDKTGTLTGGAMTLLGVMPLARASREQCLAWGAALESASEHPIAHAVVKALERPTRVATAVACSTGRGVEGRVDGKLLRIGAPDYVAELHGQALPQELAFVSDAVTVVALGSDREWLALFMLGDTLREGAHALVQELRAAGCGVTLLSGDRSRAVSELACRLGIADARGEQAPAGKRDYVASLQARGETVAMVGDGVNDGPVLAQAQVSIALASGTPLAQTAADIVLMTAHLAPLAEAIRVARRTLRIIRQNLGWAVAYNLLAVPLAVMGYVTPLAAAIGMSASSLIVVGNAARLATKPAARAWWKERTAKTQRRKDSQSRTIAKDLQ